MDLMPILATLRRHKTASALIVIEVALTAAIVCNALHLISGRIERLTRPSGLAESELVVLGLRSAGAAPNADETTARDLQALRALPGVKSATVFNQVVYGSSSSVSSVRGMPGRGEALLSAGSYSAAEQAIDTLGLKLVAGRDFLPEEYQSAAALRSQERPAAGPVIVNRAMANKLKPDGGAVLGMPLYIAGDSPSTVVGVVEQLPPVHPGRAGNSGEYAMLQPLRPNYRGGSYVLRVAPEQREALLKAATAALDAVEPGRIVVGARTLAEMRDGYYAQDRSMVWVLAGVSVALLVVTALGIVGLASFWVEQRTRMIGTRRAMGATRGQILRYFQLENFVLSSAGIALGMAGAWGLSLLLMRSAEMPALPIAYLPAGALLLWALGQLAVWSPARRAAALPPVVALRGG